MRLLSASVEGLFCGVDVPTVHGYARTGEADGMGGTPELSITPLSGLPRQSARVASERR